MTIKPTQTDQLARFRALHAPGNILVLPNAWDAASAVMVEAAGAKAVATSSAAVAWGRKKRSVGRVPPTAARVTDEAPLTPKRSRRKPALCSIT